VTRDQLAGALVDDDGLDEPEPHHGGAEQVEVVTLGVPGVEFQVVEGDRLEVPLSHRRAG
jgi:hypothetical protein